MPEQWQEGGKPEWTVEDVKARQSKAVRAWLDKQVGPEKLELAKLLQEHAVIVRGGPDHAQRLMDALIVRAVPACFVGMPLVVAVVAHSILLCCPHVDSLVLPMPRSGSGLAAEIINICDMLAMHARRGKQ